VINDCNLSEMVKELEKNPPLTRFYLFLIGTLKIVVETTATKLMNAMAVLPVEHQALFMSHLASFVPEPGDSISLMIKEGEELSVVVARQKSLGDEIRLLITR